MWFVVGTRRSTYSGQ